MTDTMTEQPHRTVSEVAKLLHLHRNTVLNHIHRGNFPGTYRTDSNRGGTYRVPQAAVDAYIERGTPPTPG